MKLKSCYVSSFGKLQDFSYDFNSGLNTVKEENGWGKSTFAAFIKAMFYGLSGNGKREIDDNERKRFTPWNSTEKFGGNITFEWDGKEYRIERFFGQKASDDTVKLYDIATGKSFTEGKAVEDLGNRIFSIDEDGFLSTTYFSQKDFEIKSNTSITAKFNEVYEVDNTAAFDKAKEKIDEKIKSLKQRGDKGRIAEIKREISLINDSMERTRQSVKTIDGLKKDFDIVKVESATLSEKMKEIAAKLEIAGKKEVVSERRKRYDSLSAELKEIQENIANAERALSGKAVSDNQVSDLEKCLRDLYDVSAKIETLKADLEEYAPKTETLSVASSKIPVSVLAVSAIFTVAGIIVAVLGGLWGLSLLGAGVIAGLFAFVKIMSARQKTLHAKQDNGRLAEIYERKKQNLAMLEDTKNQLIKGLETFFGEFNLSGNSYEQKLAELKSAIAKITESKRLSEKILKEQSELLAQGIETDTVSGESVSELNEKLKVTADWYKQKVSEAERIKTRIDALETLSDSLTDAESRRAELKEELIECERQFKILTLTADYLEKADENLKIRYRAPLQESLNKYLKLIAGQKITASIDTDMNITVGAFGAERETDFFSKGYRNLFEICKRFALTDILFTKEKPFIILDDPFYNLDDEKIAESLSLIKTLSEEYQIIYFVCHESRRA